MTSTTKTKASEQNPAESQPTRSFPSVYLTGILTGHATLDSSICNAAVHAGKLASESGGSVTIELRPGESAYKGTTRNGIKTNDYGQYGSSFVVK